MESLFAHRDARFLIRGVGLAAVAGLLMGAALRPDLNDHEIGGPQQLIGGGGPRQVAEIQDPGVAGYAGAVPDYVVGTDYLRAREPVMVAARTETPEPQVPVYDSPDDLPLRVTHATWRDEPRPPPRYPSEAGNEVYDSDLPAPPPEPEDSDLG